MTMAAREMTMAALAPPRRGRGRPCRTPQAPANAGHAVSEHAQTQKNEVFVSEYEQSREERIKQNLEKMQKLGIFDLSLQLKSSARTPKNCSFSNSHKTPPSISPLQPSGPIRRSSRLKNATLVSYSEVELAKKDKELEDDSVLAEVGSRPEVYTEEHEKLLGNTEKGWTLFVDGYGKDGKRIYDSVNGKTCHQCRQKTLGYRTQCCNCNLVQGQFCGDCLYMRYGEHVLEAIENPNWLCPVCRGICNCSNCRQAKGWAPTGTLYKKVSQLGFKSVAHYLIQTRRLEKKVGISRDTTNGNSVKRSLPFSDMSAISEDYLEATNDQPGSPKLFKDKTNDESKNNDCSQNSAKGLLPFMNTRRDSENIGSIEDDQKVDYLLGSPKHQHQNEKEDSFQSKMGKESREIECGNSIIVSESLVDPVTELRMESVADDDFPEAEEKALDLKKAVNEISLEKEMDEESDTLKVETSTGIAVNNHNNELPGVVEKVSDVKQIVEGEGEKEVLPSDVKHRGDVSSPLEKSSKLKRKRVQPSLDSIGGRVRRRHKTDHNHDEELQRSLEKENSKSKQATKHLSASYQHSSESIAGRLRSRRKSN